MDFTALIFRQRRNSRQYLLVLRKTKFLFLWETNGARAHKYLVDFMMKIFRLKFQEALYHRTL
jgi:hypothetical protein